MKKEISEGKEKKRREQEYMKAGLRRNITALGTE